MERMKRAVAEKKMAGATNAWKSRPMSFMAAGYNARRGEGR
jgi:hypothetical protein